MTIDELLPCLEGVTTPAELGHRIVAQVPEDLWRPLAYAARDALGYTWTNKATWQGVVRATPEGRANAAAAARSARATEEGREKSRAANRAACAKTRSTPEGREKTRASSRATSRATRATPEGREKHNAASRATRSTPEGREKHNAASRAANQAARSTPEGRARLNAATQATKATYYQPDGRYYTDPLYRVACAIRNGVKRISKATATTKIGSVLTLPDGTSVSWRELLGCTFAEARAIVESRFLPGMSWKNHGPVWHLDHRMPLKAYQDHPTLAVLRIVQHVDVLIGNEENEIGRDLSLVSANFGQGAVSVA